MGKAIRKEGWNEARVWGAVAGATLVAIACSSAGEDGQTAGDTSGGAAGESDTGGSSASHGGHGQESPGGSGPGGAEIGGSDMGGGSDTVGGTTAMAGGGMVAGGSAGEASGGRSGTAGEGGAGEGVPAFRHRWVAFQNLQGGSDEPPTLMETLLQDTSDLALPTLKPPECNAPQESSLDVRISFSAKGDWFACSRFVFDARGQQLGAAVSLGCVPVWSPTARNLAFCLQGTTGAFVDVSAPSDRLSFDVPANCADARWSPDGKLITYSCYDASTKTFVSYLVSPTWPERPLVSAQLAETVLSFVTADIALTRPAATYLLRPIVGRALGTPVPLPGFPARCNATSQICLVGGTSEAAQTLVAMTTGQKLVTLNTTSNRLPSPDLGHFVRQGAALAEVHATMDPDAAPIVTVNGSFESWSSDGRFFAYRDESDNEQSIGWLDSTFHSATVDSMAPNVAIAPDDSYGLLATGPTGGEVRTFRIDPSLEPLPTSQTGFEHHVVTFLPSAAVFAPSSRGFAYGFAYGACLASVDEQGEPSDRGCTTMPRTDTWADVRLASPSAAWTKDSGTFLYVTYASPLEAVTPYSYGLVAVRISGGTNNKVLLPPAVGTSDIQGTLATWLVQP